MTKLQRFILEALAGGHELKLHGGDGPSAFWCGDLPKGLSNLRSMYVRSNTALSLLGHQWIQRNLQRRRGGFRGSDTAWYYKITPKGHEALAQ